MLIAGGGREELQGGWRVHREVGEPGQTSWEHHAAGVVGVYLWESFSGGSWSFRDIRERIPN